MKSKYNIALLPQSKSNKFIQLAQQFSDSADQYLLGENSLPHITLYQFYTYENEISDIWQHISQQLHEPTLSIDLIQFSYSTYKNNLYWILLLPNKTEILHKMHATVANTLQLPIKESFEPHLTLINTKNSSLMPEIIKLEESYRPITDTFTLSLGKSDEMGQYTKVIYQK